MEAEHGQRPVRVVIADDHEFIRVGLKSIISSEPGMEVVGEAGSGEEALRLFRETNPDVVLMDIEMPGLDGIEATRRIKQEKPSTVVMIVTAYDRPDYLLEAIRAGASGYLLKEHAFTRIRSALQRVIRGEAPLDQELAMRLLKHLSEDPVAGSGDSSKERERLLGELTDREREILGRIAAGQSNQQMADELHLSVGTIKTHVHRIISKLGVSDRTQAAVLAIRLGLIPLGRDEG